MKSIGEVTEQQTRYFQWVRQHRKGGTCRHCKTFTYDAGSHLPYRNHLEESHPDVFTEFKEWAGLR